MQRRKFLIGAAGTAIGGSALVGSGAFSSVEAEREISVTIATDDSAFLRLEGQNGDYINDDSGGTLSLDLGAPTTTDGGGEGFNDEAVTEIDGIFSVANDGTQEVEVEITDSIDGVEWEVRDAPIGTGSDTLVDVTVDTNEYDPDEEEDGTVLIEATETT